MSEYQMIINGKKIAGSGTFPVLNPATEKVLAQCPKTSMEQLDQAIAAARDAFPSWRMSSDAERTRLLHEIADALAAHSDELAKSLILEQGKPMGGFAGLGAGFEVGKTIAWCHATAELELL